jgi:hypothetical protein
MNACPINIGRQQVLKRKRSGYVVSAISIIALAALFATGAPHVWRALLFAPFALAGIFFFQAATGT